MHLYNIKKSKQKLIQEASNITDKKHEQNNYKN